MLKVRVLKVVWHWTLARKSERFFPTRRSKFARIVNTRVRLSLIADITPVTP
jgi:hypothetical protein